MSLNKIAAEVQRVLDEKEEVRELALKSSRSIVRQCGSAIQKIHKGEDAAEAIELAREELDRLKGVVSEHPEIEHAGFVTAACQEYVEAAILQAIAEGYDIPSPTELSVTCQAYLEGIGDVVGELRRFALDAIIEGDVGGARDHLELMDEIYGFLMRFDYPAALASVRRKQDVARSLVEKTRSDVTMAVRARALEERLDEFEVRLGKKRF
jgi:translin